MGIEDLDSANSILRRRLRPAAAAALLALLVAGCSSVPDAMNPAEWYRDTVDFFAGEEGEPAAEEDSGVSEEVAEEAEEADYPKLSSVPERPQAREGLVGDVEGRKYAEPVQRQGEAEQSLAELEETAPPPPAQPTEEVTSEPLDEAPQDTAEAAASQSQPQPQPASRPQQTASRPARDEGPADVMSVYRRNLAQQRPDPNGPGYQPSEDEVEAGLPQRPRAGDGGSFTDMFDRAGSGGDDYGTVVISSEGVEGEAASGRDFAAAARPRGARPPQATGGESEAGFTRAQMPTRGEGVVKVATILFDTGSARLSARDKGILRKVRELQREYGARLHVIGHASSRTRNMDPVRHKMVNYEVSADRADRVASQLAGLGVPEDRLSVDAKGDNEPQYYEVMPSGEAGNRRAEVYLVY